MTILVKPGASYETRDADEARCAEAAQRAREADLPGADTSMPMATGAQGGLPGVAGAAIANLIIGLITVSEERTEAEKFCLRNLGYVEVPLTPEEATAYTKLSSKDKKAWERSFLATDLEARLQPLITPAVPRLPAYRNEPMSQGGLKIDEQSLVLSATDVENQGTIVTGKVTRSRTAVLLTPVETKTGPIRVAADAGVIFYQVDYRPQQEPLLRPNTATWCGPVRQMAGGNVAKDFYCFTGQDDGYTIYHPSGQAWLAGPYRDGFVLPLYDQPIRLEERAQDDLGPLDFDISVVSVDNDSVKLAARVHHNGKQVEIWNRSLDFDSKGQAVLPLWNLRLMFTHTAHHSVKVALTHDGDGRSWRDGD